MPGTSGDLLSPEAPDSCHEAGQYTVIKSSMVLYGEGAPRQGGVGLGRGGQKGLSRRGRVRTCGHQRMPAGGALVRAWILEPGPLGTTPACGLPAA